MRIGVGYPARDDEWAMLERRLDRAVDEIRLDAVTDRQGLVEMQQAIEQVHVTEPLGTYIVDLVSATRTSRRIQVGASPRGSLALLKLSRCKAALDGRDFVIPEDVKAVAVPALSHRLMLRPELWVQRVAPEDVVREALATVPTPAAEDLQAGQVEDEQCLKWMMADLVFRRSDNLEQTLARERPASGPGHLARPGS